jgi:sterol desaturase/sphingolipid hydroxylase (fatty acid hydroxylase superfamily)
VSVARLPRDTVISSSHSALRNHAIRMEHNYELLMFLKRLAVIVLFGGFVVALAAEMLAPTKSSTHGKRRFTHACHNLVLWLVGIVAMSIVFGGTIWIILQWLQFRRIGILYFLSLPVWLHAVAAFMLLDASDYMFHRLSHNVRWLWLLHAVHHSDTHVDVTTNLRQHPLHIVPTELWNLVACAAIGVPAWIFLVHEIVSLGFAHMHHAAIRWPRWVDKALGWLVVTPRMHWNHHSPVIENTNSNYGVILSIWDRWFGTITTPPAGEPEFGLAALNDDRWHSAWGMLATPWRARTLQQL